MTIDNRINKVSFSEQPIDSDFRAVIHKKFSEAELKTEKLKAALLEDYIQPMDAQLTKKLHKIRNGVFDYFTDVEIITLSPLGATGLDQYVTKTSPLKIAHVTGRSADVVSDLAIQLSAEAYRRRIAKNNQDISLGAYGTSTRLQRYADKSFKTYFEGFSTLDSTQSGTYEFDNEKIVHLAARYVKLLESLRPGSKIEVVLGNLGIAEKILPDTFNESSMDVKSKIIGEQIPVDLHGILPKEKLEDENMKDFLKKYGLQKDVLSFIKIIDSLQNQHGVNASFQLDRSFGLGHYNGNVFEIKVDGVTIIDGGSVDWVSKLISNKKERTVVSGFGTQMLAGIS